MGQGLGDHQATDSQGEENSHKTGTATWRRSLSTVALTLSPQTLDILIVTTIHSMKTDSYSF